MTSIESHSIPVPAGASLTDEILAGIAGRLDEQNELLGQILNRLPETAPPEPAGESAPASVELREPVPVKTTARTRTRTRST